MTDRLRPNNAGISENLLYILVTGLASPGLSEEIHSLYSVLSWDSNGRLQQRGASLLVRTKRPCSQIVEPLDADALLRAAAWTRCARARPAVPTPHALHERAARSSMTP